MCCFRQVEYHILSFVYTNRVKNYFNLGNHLVIINAAKTVTLTHLPAEKLRIVQMKMERVVLCMTLKNRRNNTRL